MVRVKVSFKVRFRVRDRFKVRFRDIFEVGGLTEKYHNFRQLIGTK